MNRSTGSSLYSYLAPARWLKSATEAAARELAKLCSHRWGGLALIPVAIPVRARRPREL
jgi:hypothetical protein